MLECEQVGRSAGLAAGLSLALAASSIVDTAPGSHAAVPAGEVPAGAAVSTHRLADYEGIVFVACPGDPARRPRGSYGLVEIGRLLAAVRIGVLRTVLDQAVEHMSNRLAGDEPLIRKQLITGTIADVMAGLELLRAYTGSQRDPVAIADVHTQLDALGWQVAQLFGAAGYLADHPARSLYVSALVANTWIDKEGAME
jgi:hypothetical protein